MANLRKGIKNERTKLFNFLPYSFDGLHDDDYARFSTILLESKYV